MSAPQSPHKASESSESPCRLWPGDTNGRGYGRIHTTCTTCVSGHHSAHRTEWAHLNGIDYHDPAMPPVVRHLCHMTLCHHPGHLAGGTHADNTADAIRRGTLQTPHTQPGDQHPRARLTAAAVAAIRCSAEPARILAQRYGVAPATITHARNGRRYKTSESRPA